MPLVFMLQFCGEIFFSSVQIDDWRGGVARFKFIGLTISTIPQLSRGVHKQFLNLRYCTLRNVGAEEVLLHYHRQVGVAVKIDITIHDACHIRKTDGFCTFFSPTTTSVSTVQAVTHWSVMELG